MYIQLVRCFQLAALLATIAALPLGAQTTLNNRVNDITVPGTASSVYIDIKGGGGGDASTFDGMANKNCDAKGGGGAIVKAVFKVGNGTNEIPAGSTLRLIRGEKGESEEYAAAVVGAGDAGGGGGGGSAVLYRRPGASGDGDWIILAVAGGGGGAYSGMFAFSCTDVDHGKGGMITNTGGSGKVQSNPDMPGGADGGAGVSFSNTSGGGAGALASAETNTANGAPAQKGYPAGGAGGHCAGCESGGWGFGGGGFSFYGPGGGGGYSGGGAGSIAEAGGGGSFLSDMNQGMYMEAGKNGSGSQDGYVKYQFNPGSNLTSSLRQATAIQFAYNPGKCIDDYGSRTSNGTNIQTYTCTGNPNQQWIFNSADRTIHSMLDFDKCLDLNQSNTNNGTNIQLWDCNGTDAQHWVYNGLFKTIHSSVNSGKCFDANGGSQYPNSNVNLQLWDCNYLNNNQKWVIDGATTVTDVTFKKHIIPVLAPNFAVHLHTGNESGSNIQLWTKDNTNTPNNGISTVFYHQDARSPNPVHRSQPEQHLQRQQHPVVQLQRHQRPEMALRRDDEIDPLGDQSGQVHADREQYRRCVRQAIECRYPRLQWIGCAAVPDPGVKTLIHHYLEPLKECFHGLSKLSRAGAFFSRQSISKQ
ncbi:MAG: ricin-type beta-trefoil lectin domain protein [Lewinellaceae bacterium]|nr:ricin-type beta-trefoil lectin domain protein [Lewinellaceae bacterium]